MATNPFDSLPDVDTTGTDKASSTSLNVSALPEPLKPYAKDFEDAGNKYGIDPNFLAAVSWNETGGGTSKAFRQGNNAMGISNASGPLYGFNSVGESIDRQASTLAKPTGPYRGASTIQEIGSIYSPPGAGNDPYNTNSEWPSAVGSFYNKLTGKSSDTPVVNSNKANKVTTSNPFDSLPDISESSNPFDKLPDNSSQAGEQTGKVINLPAATPQELAKTGTQGYPSATPNQQPPKSSQLTSGLSAGIEGTIGLLSGLGAVAAGEAGGVPVTGGASLLAVPALFTAGSALGVVGAKKAEKLLGLEPEIQASQQEYPKTAFAGQVIPQLPFAAESALGYGATALTKGAGAVAGQMAGQAAIGAGIMEPMRYGVDVTLNKMGITDQPAAPITFGSTGEQVLTALALGGKATGLAPSKDPIVNEKTAQVLNGAETQTATSPETESKPINLPPATPEELAKVGEADITETPVDNTQKLIDLATDQLEHKPGSSEHTAIQQQIDALKQPAEAPVAEAQPETPNESVQIEKAGEVGIRNAPAVGEGVGRQNEAEVPTEEGQAPKEEVTGAEEPGKKPVGINKAAVNEQRLNRLVESLPESERESNAEKINTALEVNNKSRIPVEGLISDILEKGNTARTPEEVALMTVEMNRLQLEREQLQKQFEQIKDPRPSDYAILNGEIKPIEDKLDRLEKAVDKTGTSAGRLLQMFKIMLAENYSQAALERKLLKGQRRPLTEDEKQTIAKQAEEHKALIEARDKTREVEQLKAENEAVKSRLQEALKEIESRTAKEKKTPKEPSPKKPKEEKPIDKSIVDRLNAAAERVRQERKGKLYAKISPVDLGDIIIGASHIANGLKSFGEWSAKMASEIQGATKEYLKKVWDASHAKIDSLQEKRTPEDVRARIKAEAVAGEELSHKSVDDLVKAHLEEGLRGEDQVMKAVHDDIKEIYPDATERDVRRAFSEYGKEAKINPDELLRRKSELRTLVRLQESIDRINEGLPALKTNARREKAIQEIREKQAKLNELLKTVKAPPTDEQLATAYSKKKTALKNAIEDLDKQLRTGERTEPKTRAEEPVDIEQLRSELDAMRRKREEIDGEEAPKFSAQEKENERLRKLYDKQISDLDAKLKGVEKPKLEKAPFDQNKENEQKMAERDAMRQKLKEIEKEEADRKKPSPEQKEIDRIQKQLDDANDRIAKGEKEAPTPKKEPLTEYAKRLLEDLKKAREQFKRVTGKEPESREDRYNRRRMEAIEKRIADMEDKMRRGDYSKPTRREPSIKYPATDLAESKLKTKEREIDAWREEKEKAERPNWEKALRHTSETARELTVAGINVLYKIGKYAVIKPILFPFSETAGYAAKHALGLGKVRGEYESGVSPLKTIPAYYRGYWKGMKQFFRTLKSGESDSQLLHDKRLQSNTNWARWIGSNLHAAIKNLPATAMEEVYREHLYANAIADGLIDLSNPFDLKNQMAMAGLNLKAYIASKSAKLMEDNKVAEKINELHDWAESPDKTGKINPALSLASHGIKIGFTKGIYKVGLNFLKQTVQGQTGIVRGLASALNAHWKGLDNLTPNESDYITRAFKAGAVPAALMALAVVDAFRDDKDRIFGGYYEQGRKTGDVKWGNVRINGKEYTLHVPEVEAAQFANTMARSFIKNQKKTDIGMSGINSFLESMGGIISEAPVAGPMIEIAKSPKNAGQFFVQGMVPSLSRDVAKMQDVNQKGEVQHRHPKGIVENIEMGVPVLRQTVSPISQSRGGSSRSSSILPGFTESKSSTFGSF